MELIGHVELELRRSAPHGLGRGKIEREVRVTQGKSCHVDNEQAHQPDLFSGSMTNSACPMVLFKVLDKATVHIPSSYIRSWIRATCLFENLSFLKM